MEIKMMKGQPSKLVRVTLDVTYNDLAKVEKFCPAKLTFVDPESKKVTFRVDLTEKGLHTAALGVADFQSFFGFEEASQRTQNWIALCAEKSTISSLGTDEFSKSLVKGNPAFKSFFNS